MMKRASRASESFDEWKRRVNASLYALCGMHADDLPDWSYRDAYECRVAPSVAAKRALRAAREY